MANPQLILICINYTACLPSASQGKPPKKTHRNSVGETACLDE
ncbi:MAG: hypothetical protein ACKO96_16215 [Flammeovirgaceae bacterium]